MASGCDMVEGYRPAPRSTLTVGGPGDGAVGGPKFSAPSEGRVADQGASDKREPDEEASILWSSGSNVSRRLEQERLDEKERREARRQQAVATGRPSGGRHDLVDRIERVTRYPMALLGVAWLVIAIVVVTTNLNGSASTSLVAVLFGCGPSCSSSTWSAWWSPPTVAAI